MKKRELSINERRALEYYTCHGNKAAAYRYAYGKTKKDVWVRREAATLFARPHVAEALESFLKEEESESRARFQRIASKLEAVYDEGMAKRTDAMGNEVPVGLPSAVAAMAELNRMHGNHAAVKVENAIHGEIKGFNEFYKEK